MLDKIMNHLNESQHHFPTRNRRNSGSINYFPASFSKPNRVKKSKKARSIDEQINEALDGIATANDIQPTDAIKSLIGALKKSGMLAALESSGITWHVPGDKHQITFLKNDTPLVQASAMSLTDKNTFVSVMDQLRSVAGGKAPQAGEIEREHVKEMAARARDSESELEELADMYVPQPEEDFDE